MTRGEAQTLIDYNYWARDRVMEAVLRLSPDQFTRDLGSSFKSVRDTVAHLHGAEWIWYSRWQGTSPPALPPADRFPDATAAGRAWRELETQIRTFFDSIDDAGLMRVFEYKNAAGASFSSPLWQMLQHVVNHGSYHRGQLTTMIRQLDAQPPRGMDLITFFREQRT